MPLYEYQCKKCGHRFERIQSFSAEDVKECPICQGEVERLISTPARPQFKGSGFYTTDYASPSSKPSDSGSGGSGSGGSGSSGSGAASGTNASASGKSDTGSADKGSSTKSESSSAPAPSTSSSKSE